LDNDFNLAGWVIRPRRGLIENGEKLVHVKPKVMAVLQCLAAADGEVVTRQDLFDTVWPGALISDATLSQSVAELRQAFGESAKDAKIIETIPKVGFRLVPPVRPCVDKADRETAESRQMAQGPGGRQTTKIVSLLLAIAAILVVISLAWYQGGREDWAAYSAANIKSIAVLPFTNLSSEPGQIFFVEGMQEALITELSKIESLSVVSRTSVMKYRDTQMSIPEIADELGVGVIIEGSVLRTGDMVRINAQLINAETDRHIWAESFDRKLVDILALHTEITREIASQIRVSLTPADEARLKPDRPVHPQAYELYWKAWHFLDTWSPREMLIGVDLMREAVSLDPLSAAANAGLAQSLQYVAYFDFIPALDVVDEARVAAQQAIELDGELSAAHLARGSVYQYLELDAVAAEMELIQALKLNPGSTRALIAFSWLLSESGQFQKSIELAQRVATQEPMQPVAKNALGQAHYLARNFGEAKNSYQQALDLDLNDPSSYYFLAWPYEQLGEYERAIELHRTAVQLSGAAPMFLSGLGYALAKAGQIAEARLILEELEVKAPAGSVAFIYLAEVHLGLGQLEQAIGLVEQAFEARNSHVVYLNHGPKFDPLRKHQRFQVLVDKMWGQDLARRSLPDDK